MGCFFLNSNSQVFLASLISVIRFEREGERERESEVL